MADDTSPVWARKSRGGGGGGGAIITGLMFLLALFAVLIIVLSGMHGWSFAQAGGVIDGWIGSAMGHHAAVAPAK
jgi:hypothetical protein